MTLAPETPRDARRAAEEFALEMEEANNRPLERMYERVAEIVGEAPEDTPWLEEKFAFLTAMEALGHGVGWTDDYPAHGFAIPSTEDSI